MSECVRKEKCFDVSHFHTQETRQSPHFWTLSEKKTCFSMKSLSTNLDFSFSTFFYCCSWITQGLELVSSCRQAGLMRLLNDFQYQFQEFWILGHTHQMTSVVQTHPAVFSKWGFFPKSNRPNSIWCGISPIDSWNIFCHFDLLKTCQQTTKVKLQFLFQANDAIFSPPLKNSNFYQNKIEILLFCCWEWWSWNLPGRMQTETWTLHSTGQHLPGFRVSDVSISGSQIQCGTTC